MNTKRQTIWLVSMLSLMVILSAYYLFTDNVDEYDTVSEVEDTGQITMIDEVTLEGEDLDVMGLSNGLVEDITEATLIDDLDQIDELIDQTEAVATDNQVIEHIQAGAKSGEDYLSSLVIKRDEALAKDTEQLLAITSDPQRTNDEMIKAQEQLDQIEDMQYKISDLEDQLMQDFENVVITEEKGKWKVVVQADKLERSQAVTIIDMMIQNLNITPSKIAGIQFIQ